MLANDWLLAKEKDNQPLMQAVDEILAQRQSIGLGVVMDTAQQIENAADLELAGQVYNKLDNIMEQSGDDLQDELSNTIRKGLAWRKRVCSCRERSSKSRETP